MDIKKLLKKAVEENSSDIHFIVDSVPILRKNGELVYLNDFKAVVNDDLEKEIYSILTDNQKKRFEADHGLDFSYSMNKSRFRINIYKEKGNISLAARIIKESKPTLEEIQMPEFTKDLLNHDKGLVLVTGPTGCGKSTTLAAMINYINKNHKKNIITLEDPIEFVFKPQKSVISQRQLGTDMTSFSSGLKHVLRQDPDVIMVGEMRDLETIATTITLAETGHLVLATLHTYNAAQTVDRIIDIFPSHQQNQIRSQVANTLKAVFSQRLIPRIEGGRIPAREIMIKNAAVSNLIRENKVAQIRSIIETNKDEGMVTMDYELKRLYNEGLISKEDAVSRMENPEYLVKRIR
jgi:twitching motility protein PilT